MNLADAENEFLLRLYIWSKAEWEKEINAFFPHLRMFKTGHPWNLYQFMQKLNKEERFALAIGRLKKSYPELALRCGDQLTKKEELICHKLDAFCHVRDQFQLFKRLRNDGKLTDAGIVFDFACAGAARALCNTDSSDAEFLSSELEAFLSSVPQSFEEQIKARKQVGENVKLVTKRKLQKILTQKVKDVFKDQYVECQVDEGHWTAFDVKCGDWMLTTQFTFGRQQSVLGYWHNICSQRKVPHPAIPEVMYPALFLCRCICWPCAWQWEFLEEKDVELACEEIFKYCRRFFEAAPSLLKDLDVEGISENRC